MSHICESFVAVSHLLEKLCVLSCGSAELADEDLRSAISLIIQRRCEPIAVGSVAESLAISRRTLERRFRDQLGLTVGRAIVLIRLEIARQLLRETNLSITAISVEAGFSSPSRMSNVFRRELGCSPRAVREAVAASRSTASPLGNEPQWVVSWTTADIDPAPTAGAFVALDKVCQRVVAPGEVFVASGQAAARRSG